MVNVSSLCYVVENRMPRLLLIRKKLSGLRRANGHSYQPPQKGRIFLLGKEKNRNDVVGLIPVGFVGTKSSYSHGPGLYGKTKRRYARENAPRCGALG
jgi:hypothetical protein